jgi:hypothetical protein
MGTRKKVVMKIASKVTCILEGFKLGKLGARHASPGLTFTLDPSIPTEPVGFDPIEPTFVIWQESPKLWRYDIKIPTDFLDGTLTVGLHVVQVNDKKVPQLMVRFSLPGEYRNVSIDYRHKLITFEGKSAEKWFNRISPLLKQKGLKALKFPNMWIKVNEKHNG